MAFEDLIFRLKVDGANLQSGIKKAVEGIQKEQKVSVPVAITVGSAQAKEIRDALKRAGATIKSEDFTVAPNLSIAPSGGPSGLRNQLQRILRQAAKDASDGLTLTVRPQVKIQGKVTDAELLVQEVKKATASAVQEASKQADTLRELERVTRRASLPVSRQGLGPVKVPVSTTFDETTPRPAALRQTGPLPENLARDFGALKKQLDQVNRVTDRIIERGGVLRATLTQVGRTQVFRSASRNAQSLLGTIRLIGASTKLGFVQAFGRFGVTVVNATRSVTKLGSVVSTVAGGVVKLGGSAASAFSGITGGAARSVRAVTRLTSALTRSVAILTGSGLLVGGPLFLPVAAVRGLTSAFGTLGDFGDIVTDSITLLSDKLANLPGAERAEFVRKKFEELGEEITDTAIATGRSFSEVGKATQAILSAGVGVEDVGERLEALRASSDLAVGGLTDIESAFRGLLPVQRAFGLGFQESADALFAIQRRGIAPIRELVPTLGRIAPLAAAVGLEFNQFAGALATITAQGVPVTQAVTGLRQALATFAKRGSSQAREELEKLKQVIPGLNLELSANFIRTKGLIGVVEALSKVGGNNVSLVVRRVRALQALLPLIQARARFEKDVEIITRSQGEAAAAAEVKLKTFAASVERLKRAFEAFVISIADQIARFADLQGRVDRIRDAFARFSSQIKAIPTEEIKALVNELLSFEGFTRIVDLVGRGLVGGIGQLVDVILASGPIITKAFLPVALSVTKGIAFVFGEGISEISRLTRESAQSLPVGLRSVVSATAIGFGALGRALKDASSSIDVASIADDLRARGVGDQIDNFFTSLRMRAQDATAELQDSLTLGLGLALGDRLETAFGNFLSGSSNLAVVNSLSQVKDLLDQAGLSSAEFGAALGRLDLAAKLDRTGLSPERAANKVTAAQQTEIKSLRASIENSSRLISELDERLGSMSANTAEGFTGLITDQTQSLKSLLVEQQRTIELLQNLGGERPNELRSVKEGRRAAQERLEATRRTIEFLRQSVEKNRQDAAALDALVEKRRVIVDFIEQAKTRVGELTQETRAATVAAGDLSRELGAVQIIDEATGGRFSATIKQLAESAGDVLSKNILGPDSRGELREIFERAASDSIDAFQLHFKSFDPLKEIVTGATTSSFFEEFLRVPEDQQRKVLLQLGEIGQHFRRTSKQLKPGDTQNAVSRIAASFESLAATLRGLTARFDQFKKGVEEANKVIEGSAENTDTFFVRVASRARSQRALFEALGNTLQEAGQAATRIPSQASAKITQEVTVNDERAARARERGNTLLQGIRDLLASIEARGSLVGATGAAVGGSVVNANRQTFIVQQPVSDLIDDLAEVARGLFGEAR